MHDRKMRKLNLATTSLGEAKLMGKKEGMLWDTKGKVS